MHTKLNILVIVVIGAVCALIGVPLVGKLKAMRDRTECENALRFVGLGINNYYDALHHYPTADASDNTTLPIERRISWLAALQLYLEGKPPAMSLHWDEAWDSTANLPVGRVRFRSFVCPAWTNMAARAGLPITNYVGITGVGSGSPYASITDVRAGFLGFGRVATRADIKDGVSCTIAVLETCYEPGPWISAGLPTSRFVEASETAVLGAGGQFGGLHKAVANGLFVDGSVHSFGDTMEPAVLRALVTIAGGERISASEY